MGEVPLLINRVLTQVFAAERFVVPAAEFAIYGGLKLTY